MPTIYIIERSARFRKHYGFLHFLVDMALIFLTGGLWTFWIIYRFIHNR